jgi:uncharacterized protein YigE (DUF2233 family)
MKLYLTILASGFLLGSSLFLMCGNAGRRDGNPDNTLSAAELDTAKKNLQAVVEASYSVIAQYAAMQQQEQQLKESIDSIKLALKAADTAIVKHENYDLAKICADPDIKNTALRARQRLRLIYDTIFRLEESRKKMQADQLTKQATLTELEQAIKRQQPQAAQALKQVQAATDTLSGAITIRFNQKSFRIFVARKKQYEVQVHSNSNKASTFKELKSVLQKKKNTKLLMLMNGGMYKPDYSPQGLLVSNRKVVAGADTSVAVQEGNFYLYPNGIFCIDSTGSFEVMETQQYVKAHLKKNKMPVYATQSGPMLVTNKQLHLRFNPASSNFNIRNGVGRISQDKIIFIIADEPVSFFDFAIVFRYFFNCSDALYLDGAISKMYLNGDKEIPGGEFGPMISITKTEK